MCCDTSVVINNNSTIETVMVTGDIFSDLNIIRDMCKYIVHKTTGTGYKLKWSQIKNMTVGTFKRLTNLHDDYVIEIDID